MNDSALDMLLRHDRWATEQVLVTCVPLTDDQLDRRFEMGMGMLRATLTHLTNVITGWTTYVAHGKAVGDVPAGSSVETLRQTFARSYDAFEASMRAIGPDTRWTDIDDGKTSIYPAVAVGLHVITHSMHHRAQTLNMLRHLGVRPLPQSSVAQWARATGVADVTTHS